jgi:hypothetical protein
MLHNLIQKIPAIPAPMIFKHVCSLWVVLLVAACAVGCSRGTPSAVTGKVLLDGQPLAGASVQLIPSGNDALGMHSQTTDRSGNFRFAETGSSNNPIQPGSYVVLVSKTELPPDAASMPGGGMGATRELVPVVYQDRALSPLKVEITGANTELPPLQLKSEAK